LHPSKKEPGKPGKLYRYPKVSAVDFAEWMQAESIGAHYARVIKVDFGPGELIKEQEHASP
jgi:hypothetical protein